MEDGGVAAVSGEVPASDAIDVTVKFKGMSFPLSISANATTADLKSLLQPITDVLPRGQKLIHKGKLLVDSMTLAASEVKSGSKIMLMNSQGLHQGSGPIIKEARSAPISRTNDSAGKMKGAIEVPIEKRQEERWKATGVIALSECNLKAIPDGVWSCGPSARVLDISKNYIRDIPSQVSCLVSLQKLHMNVNDLSDDSVSWEVLSCLKSLSVMSLCQNNFTTLPSVMGALSSLRQLHVSNNQLVHLPSEIGLLTNLEVLKVSHNRLSSIPESIGDCSSLIEVDISSNLLKQLPQTFGKLKHLKILNLNNNGLKSLPSTLFKMCTELLTLNLHGTEITMDVLRQFEGWEAFDQRRCLKLQKRLDFRTSGAAEFDEGADKH